MADKEIVAATIAAILAAHGKTKQKNIQKAVRAYHACLDELNKPRQPPDPEWSKEDDAAIDRASNEGGRLTPEQERRIREGDLDVV